MLAVFTLGSSGFSVEVLPGEDCGVVGAQAWVDTMDDGWGGTIAFYAYIGHWNACMDTGGYSDMEVTIIAN